MKKYNLDSKIIQSIVGVFILLTSIYMLYFYIPEEEIYEGFGMNYKNMCKGKKTHFYDVTGTNLNKTVFTIDDTTPTCSNRCDTSNCDVFTVKDNVCSLYNDLSNSDFSVKINCDELPANQFVTYEGEGFVRPSYLKDNEPQFVYKDYLLEQANSIKADYMRGMQGTQGLNQKLLELAHYFDISVDSIYINPNTGTNNNTYDYDSKQESNSTTIFDREHAIYMIIFMSRIPSTT